MVAANRLELDLDVLIEAEAWQTVPQVAELCRRAALAALAVATDPPPYAAACLLLGDDEAIRALNRRFRRRDGATNVLSFPAAAAATETPRPLGDIIIAHGVTASEAAAEGKTIAQHLCHLVVHGMLHLMGYDHQTDGDAEIMETLERDALHSLGVADPYSCLEQ
jgi:probable rRNA maturation factor